MGGLWSAWAQDHYTEPTRGITSPDSYAYRDVDADAQIDFVRSHPIDFLQAMGSSLGDHGFAYVRDALGQTGGWNTPWPLVLVIFGVVTTACWIDARRLAMARATCAIALAVAAVMCVALFVLAYVGWNAVRAPRVDEFQGRYLYPLIAVLALAGVPALPSAERMSSRRTLQIGRVLVAVETVVLAVVLAGITRTYW